MADWYYTDIEFTDPARIPTHDERQAIRAVLQVVDSDTPELRATGMCAKWRSPAIDVEAVCDVIHFCGFPCRGRSWQAETNGFDNPVAPDVWHASTPTIATGDGWRRYLAVALVDHGFADVVPTNLPGLG